MLGQTRKCVHCGTVFLPKCIFFSLMQALLRSMLSCSHAFSVNRILFWAFASAAKGKTQAEISDTYPSSWRLLRGPTEKKRNLRARFDARLPWSGTHNPHLLFRNHAYLQGWALCSHSGLTWWHFHILQASPKIISCIWKNSFSKPTFYCLLGIIH